MKHLKKFLKLNSKNKKNCDQFTNIVKIHEKNSFETSQN